MTFKKINCFLVVSEVTVGKGRLHTLGGARTVYAAVEDVKFVNHSH